jgi:hypothetical protein
MGGTDEASNMVLLNIDEHAEAHRLLYETHGLLEDKLAWKGLAGLMGKEEIMAALYKDPTHRKKISDACMGREPWNKGKTGVQVAWNKGIAWDEETKLKMSGPRPDVKNAGKYTRSDEIKEKQSNAAKNETKISCTECGTMIRLCHVKIHVGSKKCKLRKSI